VNLNQDPAVNGDDEKQRQGRKTKCRKLQPSESCNSGIEA
jgi:hypothetical protein